MCTSLHGHRKYFIIQSHVKITENHSPQKSIDKPQRVGRKLDEETKTWILERFLSFKELCALDMSLHLTFLRLFLYPQMRLVTNDSIGLGQRPNETCETEYSFASLGGVCCL